MTSHRPPSRQDGAQYAAPRAGPAGQLGPVAMEGLASVTKPAAVTVVDVTALATGWQAWRTAGTVGRIG